MAVAKDVVIGVARGGIVVRASEAGVVVVVVVVVGVGVEGPSVKVIDSGICTLQLRQSREGACLQVPEPVRRSATGVSTV
jgi:hypothetical protein